jgi:hypothetical protein
MESNLAEGLNSLYIHMTELGILANFGLLVILSVATGYCLYSFIYSEK